MQVLWSRSRSTRDENLSLAEGRFLSASIWFLRLRWAMFQKMPLVAPASPRTLVSSCLSKGRLRCLATGHPVCQEKQLPRHQSLLWLTYVCNPSPTGSRIRDAWDIRVCCVTGGSWGRRGYRKNIFGANLNLMVVRRKPLLADAHLTLSCTWS